MTPDNPLSADASCLEKAIGAYVDARERGEDPGPEEFVIPYPKCTVELRAFIDDYRRTHDLFASFRAEATQDYSPPTASPSGPEKAVRVALPTDAEPPTAAVEQTLRQRLRAVALLIALGVSLARGVGLVFAYPRLLADPLSAFTQRPCYGNAALVVCLEVLAFVLLSPRRSAGLRRLRLLEWLVFAPPAVAIAWDEILGLAGSAPAFGHDSALMLAYGKSLTWVLFMVGYGVLVPNTWRRCAAVVGLLTLLGLLPDVCVLTWQGVETGPLAVYLVNKVFWFSVAATIVIYGARRLEILGREAAALGHYRLKGRLGAGGMGEVFLAEHVLLRRPCALKLIRPERAGDAKTLQRFEREVRATATLTHPNTVQVFDYGHTEGGTFYYVMEYLPGLTLEELVQRDGPLPPARAVHLLRQVCGALREAHAIGLIHRDVKPRNILVCQRGGVDDVAKLLDFGLVRIQDGAADVNLTAEHAIAGTPAYMSPEQADGRENIDGRADLYSLGAVAYFLLTGRPPFVGESVGQVLRAHLCEAPEPPSRYRPEVPADLEAVVLRCLAKEPADRFPDAQALDEALAVCAAVAP